ncbi:MAG: hypothetical protein LC808_03135 [Actinobacteria bacterium]|nr:hypothetical protein [Actinomycetota bacterium]
MRRLVKPSWGRWVGRAAVALSLFALVLLGHGALPGMVNNAAIAYLGEGSIRCLHDLQLGALTSWCHSYGEPLGYPLLTWGPFVFVGALFMHLPSIDSGGAYLLAFGVFDAAALAGGYLLMRRLGAGWLVALGTASAYLLTPTLMGLRYYGGTFTGYTLLPAYILIDMLVIEAVERRRGRTLAVAAIGYAGVKTGALFMDGYSFIAGNLVSVLLWVAWAARARVVTLRRAAGPVLFLGANLAALALYAGYVPDVEERHAMWQLRALGLDLVTLVSPSQYVWPAAHFGFTVDHTDLWDGGSSAPFNYVGFLCLGLALVGLTRRFRDPRVAAIALAGLLALVMSFGPVLKVDTERPPAAQHFVMPEGAAPELPWSGLFSLPGVNSMRATHRWFGVTRLALVILAGLGIALLWRGPRRRRLLAVGLAAVATAELAPNLPFLVSEYRGAASEMEAVTSEVGGDLRAATRPGERVFFLDYDGVHNDWMVNFLAPAASLRAFNAGGDKNAAMAARRWPAEVRAMARPGVTGDHVASAFRAGRTDVVIAPYFPLLAGAYPWPPPNRVERRARRVFAPIVRDPRFRVERRRWLAAIRPATE